jgi:ParB family transcriptional regulator, chromosome partitioning protein
MSDTAAVDAAKSTFQSITLDQIKPSRHQARKQFDEAAIKSLSDSIASEGLQNPVTVRRVEGGYELISGERRFRAVKLLGLRGIDAHIIDVGSEASAAAKGLLENLQRVDLNPIEEAEGFRELNQLDPKYWDQPKIGSICDRSQEYVSLSLKLLGLAPAVQESIRRRILSRSHGLELMRLPADKQEEASNQVTAKSLDRNETRKLVDQMLGKGEAAKVKPPKAREATDLTWKGEEIAINRHFKPAGESVQDYIAWLTLALQAFAETKPVGKSGHSKEVVAPLDGTAVVEKMVQPVREAAAHADSHPPIQLP